MAGRMGTHPTFIFAGDRTMRNNGVISAAQAPDAQSYLVALGRNSCSLPYHYASGKAQINTKDRILTARRAHLDLAEEEMTSRPNTGTTLMFTSQHGRHAQNQPAAMRRGHFRPVAEQHRPRVTLQPRK